MKVYWTFFPGVFRRPSQSKTECARYKCVVTTNAMWLAYQTCPFLVNENVV